MRLRGTEILLMFCGTGHLLTFDGNATLSTWWWYKRKGLKATTRGLHATDDQGRLVCLGLGEIVSS